ncbi:hypothetical protein BDN67DRAFT_971594 [Paxillus ammoniavirescens]|nr:hypothetical protein BDN67DRAFT_971594 [Paxillus ammoniavirescens]
MIDVDALLRKLGIRVTFDILRRMGVVARFVLLVLMLASLRDLPPSAHETVSWTVYIPHL